MKISKLFWIGLLTTVSIVSFVIGILYLQDITFDKSNYSFTIIFDNVQGLNEGDDVNILGKRIGKVSNIKILGKQAAVEVSIDNSFALSIPIDSKLEVKSEGLMGSKYIAIVPGLNTDKSILAGETVEGKREYDFSEITPGIIPLTQDLGAFARRLKATLGEEQKDQIRTLIKNLESITTNLESFSENHKEIITSEDKENIHVFLRNLTSTSEELQSGIKTDIEKLTKILDDIEHVSRKSGDLSSTIDNFKKSSQSLMKTTESLGTSADKLKIILDKADIGDGTLSKLLNDDSAYNNMDSLFIDIRTIVQDFKDNPSKYLKAYFKAKK